MILAGKRFHVLKESAESFQISRLPWDVFVLPTGEPPGWPVPAEQRHAHRLAGALLNRFRARISVEIRLGEAWRDRIDLDSFRVQLKCHGKRQSVESCLGCRVDGAENRAVRE